MTTQAPQHLMKEGVSVLGVGVMGSAYTARLAKLGVPVTVWNRSLAKAAEIAKAVPGVKVAATVADAAKASPNVLVACSPTHAAIGAICEQLAPAARGKHVTFIVDSGLAQARLLEEALFDKGGAASVTFAAMFGTAGGVMDGQTLINAGGKSTAPSDVSDHVMPLLGVFGAAAYHPGGAATGAFFAQAGHMAFMPMFYGLMHYVAMMSQSGIDPKVSLGYFQTATKITSDMFVPLLGQFFEKHDYSVFFGSHRTLKEIYDCSVETCKALEVDPRLSELMREYHERAMKDPELSGKSYHSAHEVICQPHA